MSDCGLTAHQHHRHVLGERQLDRGLQPTKNTTRRHRRVASPVGRAEHTSGRTLAIAIAINAPDRSAMDEATTELTERFERYCDTKDREIPSDVLAELQSMLRLYSISPEELDFKWQAHALKMGEEGGKMDVKTARDFKKTLQDALERESRGKAQHRNEPKRGQPTPRAKGGDMYDMYVGPAGNVQGTVG